LVVLVVVLGWPATAAGQAPLATNTAGGPIAAWSSVVAWSAWDDAAGGYRLVVDREGARMVLPVAAQQFPFDVQAGPGPDGGPWLVWSRCEGGSATEPSGDCDVVAWDVAAGREQRVAEAATQGRREFAPAIWRGRIAFAHRRIGRQTRRTRTRLAVAPVAGGRARAAPGMPVGNCGGAPFWCGSARPTDVVSLALRDDALAVSASYGVDGNRPGICGFQEVRLADLRTGIVRRVSPTATCGLSGAQYSAVRFSDSGRLWYVRSCPGDPGGCSRGRSGPFRYTPASGRTTRLEVSLTPGFAISSVAVDREQLVIQESPESFCVPDPGFRCATVRRVSGRLVRQPVRRDRAAPGGYRLARRGSLVIARPPRELACFDADPAPRRRAVLWAGAGTVASPNRHAVPSPVVQVRATTPGRPALRGALARSATGRWRWRRLSLGRAGCGRTWTLSYRARGRRLAAFSVRVSASPRA
jgi:hypothetical protein